MSLPKTFKKLLNLDFLVFSFIIIYSIAAISVSLNRYWQFNAFWYDFGILDETIWKLAHFHLPIIENLSPPGGAIYFRDHFSPSLALLAPFYWISKHQETILIAQVLFASLSALVFYKIAKSQIKNRLAPLAIVFAYLGFVGMQNALFTDIHSIVFALLPFSLTIWAFFKKKWTLYLLFLLIFLGVQENFTLVGIGLGLFLIIKDRKNLKIAGFTILISASYAFFVTKIAIPALGGSYSYEPSIPTSVGDFVKAFFIPYSLKTKAIVSTFATFGFLPLFSAAAFPLIFLHYLERFVLNAAGTRWDLGLHYNAILSPIMALAAIESIKKIETHKFGKKLITSWSILTVLLVIVLHRFILHGPLLLSHNRIFYRQTDQAKVQKDFAKIIPTDGLLMTQNNLAAHFTHSKTVLLNEKFAEIMPDYIAVDLRPGQNPNNFFPVSEDSAEKLVASASANLNYEKENDNDFQFIFKKIK